MARKTEVKWILSVLGLILISVIANGLTPTVFSPLYNNCRAIVQRLTTLGLHSLDESFYKKVAWGLFEDPAYQSSGALLYIILGCITYLLIQRFIEVWNLTKSRDGNKKRKAERQSIWSQRILVTFSLIIFSQLIVQQMTCSYRNHLVTVFRQKFTIAKLFMDEQEEEMTLVDFLAIQNKQDYLDVMSALKGKVDTGIEKLKSDKKATQSKP